MGDIAERQAEHLQELLSEQNIRQYQLAEELGFSTTSVNRWAKGHARMSRGSAERIRSRYPEYSVEWLQGGADDSRILVEHTLDTIRSIQDTATVDELRAQLRDAQMRLASVTALYAKEMEKSEMYRRQLGGAEDALRASRQKTKDLANEVKRLRYYKVVNERRAAVKDEERTII